MQYRAQAAQARSTIFSGKVRRYPDDSDSDDDDDGGDNKTRLGLGPNGPGPGIPSQIFPGPPSAPSPPQPPGQLTTSSSFSTSVSTTESHSTFVSTSSITSSPVFTPSSTRSSTQSTIIFSEQESTTISISVSSQSSETPLASFTLSPTLSGYTFATRTASQPPNATAATSQAVTTSQAVAASNKPSTAAVAVGLTVGILTFILILIAAFLFLYLRRKRAQPVPGPAFEPNVFGASEKQARNFLSPPVAYDPTQDDWGYGQTLHRNPTTRSSQVYQSVLRNPLAQHPVRSPIQPAPVSRARRLLAAALSPRGTPGPPTPPPKPPPGIVTTSPSSPTSSHFSIMHPQPLSAQARMFHETWGNIRSQRPTPVQGEARSSLHITVSNGRLVKEGRPVSWMFLDPSDATTIHSSAEPSVAGHHAQTRWSTSSQSAHTRPALTYSPL